MSQSAAGGSLGMFLTKSAPTAAFEQVIFGSLISLPALHQLSLGLWRCFCLIFSKPCLEAIVGWTRTSKLKWNRGIKWEGRDQIRKTRVFDCFALPRASSSLLFACGATTVGAVRDPCWLNQLVNNDHTTVDSVRCPRWACL